MSGFSSSFRPSTTKVGFNFCHTALYSRVGRDQSFNLMTSTEISHSSWEAWKLWQGIALMRSPFIIFRLCRFYSGLYCMATCGLNLFMFGCLEVLCALLHTYPLSNPYIQLDNLHAHWLLVLSSLGNEGLVEDGLKKAWNFQCFWTSRWKS